jgi:thioredoxin 1
MAASAPRWLSGVGTGDGFTFAAGSQTGLERDWKARADMAVRGSAPQSRACSTPAPKPRRRPPARALCVRMGAHISGRLPQGWEVLAMSSDLIKHVSDSSFESDVIKSDKPVLVDFWAEWCGPCKGIAPILDEASKDYDGRLQIAKLNVDENRDVPAKFGIRGIPTLMLFKDGELAATKVGALSKAQLTAFLDGHL